MDKNLVLSIMIEELNLASRRYPAELARTVLLVSAKMTVCAGIARYNGGTKAKSITISSVIHTADATEDLRDTIRHELAHIVGMQRGDRGHGPVWKAIAISLGSSGRIFHTMEVARAPLPKLEDRK